MNKIYYGDWVEFINDIPDLNAYGKSQYDKGVEEERKEWLKGNRCSACGDSNLESGGLSDVCNNCVEDQ